MNLEELQSVRDSERRTDKLQELREEFYADAGQFIQKLRDRRDQAADAADDPYDDPDVKRLTDEIDTAEQTVEAIYEKRVGKIVKAASFEAANLPAGSEGMTAEERQLFETLVDDITANRQHVLDVLAGDPPDGERTEDSESTSTAEPTEPQPGGTDTQRPAEESAVSDRSSGDQTTGSVDAAAAMGGSGSASQGQDGTNDRTDRETVRITDDVGAIFGVDEREYDLSEDDVVQLPAANAVPLVERDAAERLD